MNKLKELRLDLTGITSLSPSIGALKNLEVLSLDTNGLSDLPLTLAFCQKIRTISLKDNSFTCLPVALLKLKGIRNLNVEGNHLIKPESITLPTSIKSTAEAHHTASLICSASALSDLLVHWEVQETAPNPKQCESLVCSSSNLTACMWCNTTISYEGKNISSLAITTPITLSINHTVLFSNST